jgi:hypothetical protein
VALCYSAMALHLVLMAGKQSKSSDSIAVWNFAWWIQIFMVHDLHINIEVQSQLCISVMTFHLMLASANWATRFVYIVPVSYGLLRCIIWVQCRIPRAVLSTLFWTSGLSQKKFSRVKWITCMALWVWLTCGCVEMQQAIRCDALLFSHGIAFGAHGGKAKQDFQSYCTIQCCLLLHAKYRYLWFMIFAQT